MYSLHLNEDCCRLCALLCVTWAHDRAQEAAQGLQAQLVSTSMGLCFYQGQQLSVSNVR